MFTIPAALSGANLTESPVLMVAYALGGLGPAVAAILLTYLTQDREGRRDYWRRIVDFRRIPLKWYGEPTSMAWGLARRPSGCSC